jgi:hypothetical protein
MLNVNHCGSQRVVSCNGEKMTVINNKSTGVRSYLCKKKPVKIKHEVDGDLN